MSRLNMEKKLLPAKKAWKSFTSAVQKNLHKLKKSKAIKKTTKNLNITLGAVLSRPLRFGLKGKALSRPSSALRIRRNKTHQLRPVYVDELFMQNVMVQMTSKPKKKASKPGAATDRGGSSNIVSNHSNINKVETKLVYQPALSEPIRGPMMDIKKTTNDFPGCSSSSTSQLRGVDERAEEFITKFKEEMRLQRQRSFGEFQEMLARSA
ncbi:hypothetical protein FRX31_034489 [Thalictrum thalictroides]|uniref:Cotton fiber protein n=1 Tax=Thalictrum thalictroides TaxID=46969 RepID=A0A7J6UTK0_THATH|nr:hypothetical protein FRX31_034489 [Thalictrum thalictroides]